MTVKIGSTTHNVATQLRHEPFGPLSSWTYGNGLMRTASFDMDGRLTALSTRNGAAYSQKLDYQYTATNEISRITNAANTPLTQSYGYDALSRLTTVTASGANQSFAWDANGNRTSHVWGGQTDLYATASGSNRLTGITGPRATSYTYDANGNTLSGEGATYSYSPFNRLSGVTKGGKTQEYWINPLGQRTLKRQTGVLDTQLGFVYGPSGQVEVEYAWGDSNANRRWTHYLRLPNGEPVAMVRNKQLYMIHTDHLSRPELATNSAKAVVWRANNYAFDRTVTLDSIGGLNLGFPGQYHDVETGLAYNYFRTYNPRTGRYLESDPIGLMGGLNTYAYVAGNPMGSIDPFGLVTWRGTVHGGSLAGVLGYQKMNLRLTSDCALGESVTVDINVSFFIASQGAPISYTVSHVELRDLHAGAYPEALTGLTTFFSASAAAGGGASYSTLSMGDAFSDFSLGGQGGWDASIAVGVGRATIDGPPVITSCGCEK
ncbi:RHS repeat-associated core domain-containing protein [Stenotrophomonas daejeonensis]|uniref:RHS repeat-associated core domain-containing protein n=1 Tax=Stenotrophomonas daejeonensis TaxID=659018 RepID=UPI00137B5A9C|nr:RHS repeat-associated core domain-containing protein [Stenotrophomonas daejeonensis]